MTQALVQYPVELLKQIMQKYGGTEVIPPCTAGTGAYREDVVQDFVTLD